MLSGRHHDVAEALEKIYGWRHLGQCDRRGRPFLRDAAFDLDPRTLADL